MRRSSIGAMLAGLMLFAVSPALAATMTSPDGGARVWPNTSATEISVRDAKCDGYWVYGYWNNTSNRLNNKSGCNTTATKSGLSITAVRACTEIPLAADKCSNWG